MRARAEGFTLIEALAALTLSALLATAVVGTVIAQMRLARAIVLRAAATDAARTTAWVLTGEARRSRFEDVRAAAADSVALRAIRGRGIVCSVAGRSVLVRYTGDRAPNAAKDSVLLIGAGGESVAALFDVRAPTATCPARPAEQLLLLDLDRAPLDAAIILIFEAGSYYLAARAFRYRTGAEGRQPLTAEVLAGSSRFDLVDEAAIGFTLAPDSLGALTGSARFAPTPRTQQ